MSNYFSGQGRVFLAQRNAQGQPLNLRWVGNVPSLSVSLNTETVEHKESHSGSRLTDLRLITQTTGEFSCTLEELNAENLELALYGQTESVTAGSVTNENLPLGINAGDMRLLAHQFVSAVTVTDSTGTPRTLPPAQYTVHANQGAITFNDITAGGPYVQPFRVSYTRTAARRVGMFRSSMPEVWLRFDGINTAQGNAPVVLDLYRVAINPMQNLSLISNELFQMELSGAVLADVLQPVGGPLGRFGRFILPGA